MRLANQLVSFVPDLAQSTPCFQQLDGKGVKFIWLSEHQEEFEVIKNILTSKVVMRHLDNSKEILLLTDASGLHGLGFALGHMEKDQDNEYRLKIVTCSSKSLTSTQMN